jgi:hypothetical protein
MAHELYEVDADGGLHVYPHEGQWRALNSEARWVAVIAGTQSGKTSFLPIWLRDEIERCGPGDYLFASPTYRLLEVKALPEFLRYFGRTLELGRFVRSPVLRFIFSDEGCRRTFGDAWSPSSPPTQVFFGHAANPESLESATYKAAVLDEAGQKTFKQGSFEAVRRRLSLARGRAMLATTPYDLGWLKTQVYDRWVNGDPLYDVVNFKSTANPTFSQEEYDEAKAVLPAWRHAMFYDGIFSRPAGQIYDNFDTAKHVVKRFPIPPHWRRIVGLDFGQVNTAAIFLAERPGTRQLFAYKEYGPVGGRTAKQHYAAMIRDEPLDPTTKKRIKLRAVGGAPSEDDWRDEFTGAGLYVEQPPISDVEVGIDRVYGTIARNELFVFSDLERTRAQFADYSRKVDEAHDYEVLEEIEDKARYHLCFVADTMVTTDRGGVPIQDVRPGMLVLTRVGYRRVADAAMTGRDRPLLRVTFSDGSALTGTPDHPLWVQGKGWIPLDALRYDDCIIRVEDARCERRLRSSTGSRTTVIRTLRARLTAAISSARARRSIERCGSSTEARSRPAFTSTTSISTRPTTRCPTSSCCRAAITSIRDTLTSLRSGSPSSTSSFGRRRLAGISPRRVGRGTASTHSANRLSDPRAISSVSAVERRIRPGRPAARFASARTLAGPLLVALPALTTSSARARAADRPTPSTASSRRASAPVRVLDVREAGRADVFNLTVEDQHEYFANGVLVSNCDAIRYAISSIRTAPGPAGREMKVRVGGAPGSTLPSKRPSKVGVPKPTMWDLIDQAQKQARRSKS